MVDAYLAEKSKGIRIPGLNPKDILLSQMRDENDLIRLKVVSEGDLSDPKADILTPIGKLSERVQDGKDAVDSIEKNLKSIRDSLFGN